jgi:predicted nucleic acid-binding protein
VAQTGRKRKRVNPILVDTGFLVALYDRREPMHNTCRRLHEQLENPLATCEAVIVEALHLLRSLPKAKQDILASIDLGILEIRFRLSESAGCVQTLLEKYRDTPAGFADACLIAMADELDTGDILTLDSDFAHYRWRRTRPFRMLIPLD